ncbi:MAG: O-antigen ligase family protein [Nitrospirae bacterium]|nr:O-antigen ligase family protein [Nitrospirota bacterium]
MTALLAVHLVSGIRLGRLEFVRTPLDAAVGLFLIASIISLIIAPYKHMAMTWVAVLVFYALYLYLARAALALPGATGYAVLAVLGMGAVESAWGIAQWAAEPGRPHGSFFNPNMLAGYVVPPAVLAASLLIHRHKWAARRYAAFGLACLAAMCAAVVVASGSRGGALSLAAGMSVVLWKRSRRLAVASVVVLALALAAFPNPVRERVMERETGGGIYAYSRTDIWRSSVKMALDHPAGVGLGNFKYHWPRYNFPISDAAIKYGKMAATAHNEYIQVWAETGVAGLLVFLYGIFMLARGVWSPRDGLRDAEEAGVSAGLAAGAAAVLVHGLVDSNLHEPGIVFLLLLLSACAFEVNEGAGARRWTVEASPGARARLAVMSGLLALALAVWAAMPALAYCFLEKGKDALKAGNKAEALRLTEAAVAVEPGNASCHDQKAAVLYSVYASGGGEGAFEEALAELEEASRLNPLSGRYVETEADLLFGRAASGKDRQAGEALASRALELYSKASALNPYDAYVLFDMARVRLFLGRPDEAASTLETLVGYEPDFLGARLLLASIYREQGRKDLSREQCYSIISRIRSMEKVPLTREEASFVGVDEARVRELLDSLGGARN